MEYQKFMRIMVFYNVNSYHEKLVLNWSVFLVSTEIKIVPMIRGFSVNTYFRDGNVLLD